MAWPRIISGQARHWLAVRDAKLLTDDVNTGDQFSDGVFNLDSGVHLKEKEFTRWCQQKFHGTRSNIINGFSRSHSGLPHRFAKAGLHRRAGGFLKHLLMPSLDAAFSLTEVNCTAVRIGEHLDFDVF